MSHNIKTLDSFAVEYLIGAKKKKMFAKYIQLFDEKVHEIHASVNALGMFSVEFNVFKMFEIGNFNS